MSIATIITTSGIVAFLINVIGIFWIKERLKQSIKHEYDQDIIHIKNTIEFEFGKKNKLYDGKLSQYKKYFSLMDSYSIESRKPLFDCFQKGLLEMIKDPSEENTLKYMQDIFALQNNASDTFLTFKNELNGLRLEAGEKLLSLLDEYIAALEITQEKTVEFLTWMNSNATSFVTDPEATNAHVQEFMANEFSTEGKLLLDIQSRIFREMRNELGIV